MRSKTKRPATWAVPLAAALLLAAIGAALYLLARGGAYSLTLHQLSFVLIYPTGVLLLTALFSWLPKDLPQGWAEGKRAGLRTLAARLRQGLVSKKAASAETTATGQGEEPPAPVAEEAELSPAAGLQEIRPREAERAEKKQSRWTRFLALLYLACHGLLAASSLFLVFGIQYPMTPGYFVFTYLHVVLLLIFAGSLLLAGKLIAARKGGGRQQTASGLLRICGGVLLVAAGLAVLRILFHLDAAKPVFWLCRILPAALALQVAVALCFAAVRKTLLTDFSYRLLPEKRAEGRPDFAEALEENTGISLKSLWSLQYLWRLAPAVPLVLSALLLTATTVYVVQPGQQAAVFRLGSFQRDSVMGPGLHLKLPWPIDKAEYYDVEQIRSMQVGYRAEEASDFLWTQSHGGDEYTLLMGNGTELVSVNMKLLYKISDLYAYLTGGSNAEGRLSARAYELLMHRTVSTTLDQFLSTDRAVLSRQMEEALEDFCKEAGLGLSVRGVVVQSIHPPIQIADVYQGVVSASLNKNAMVISARTEAEKILTDARRQSESALIDASAAQIGRVAEAEFEMAVYHAAFEAYQAAPESFMLHKYLSTYEKIIGGNKVYVFMPGTDSDLSRYVFGARPGSSDKQETLVVNAALEGSDQR